MRSTGVFVRCSDSRFENVLVVVVNSCSMEHNKFDTKNADAGSKSSGTLSKRRLNLLTGDAAWLCMSSIKGGHLIRWQVLKAAAKERDYKGPISYKDIANDPERARSAWLAWLQTKEFHLKWLHVKLDDLMSKAKFESFRRILLQSDA